MKPSDYDERRKDREREDTISLKEELSGIIFLEIFYFIFLDWINKSINNNKSKNRVIHKKQRQKIY